MTLGKLINCLQQAEMELGSDAEVVILLDNWWDCRSSDKEWPPIVAVVQMPAVFDVPNQVGISFTPEPPAANIMTWERLEKSKTS